MASITDQLVNTIFGQFIDESTRNSSRSGFARSLINLKNLKQSWGTSLQQASLQLVIS